MILQDWLQQAEARLRAAGVDSPRLDAQMLAAHVLLVERPWILAHPEAEINELAAETVLQRRESREPLAYILGWREFYSRRFAVGPGVLIPRQETETLVDAAIELLGAPDFPRHPSILDLGTGSGCIAITLKLELSRLRMAASDISSEALEIARRNQADLVARVSLVQADGLIPFQKNSFDLIISNPPYIGQAEELMTEVADHEPSNALYSGPTGFEFYERLAREAAKCLTVSGHLLVELGYGQQKQVEDLFTSAGWTLVGIHHDLAGIARVAALKS